MSDTPQQQSDKSKFIRTYAKDVATLTGGQAKSSVPAPQPIREVPPLQAPTVSADTEREATLARLRKKVEEERAQRTEAIPAPPPPKPVFEAPLPPPPAPLPQVDKAPGAPSPIHTYKTDFADRIDQKGATAFSVLAAQQDAKPTPIATQQKKKNTVMVVAAVLLIAIGGGGLGTAAWYVLRDAALPGGVLSAPSLVFADEQVRLTSSGPDLMSEIAALANEPVPDGHVLVVYLTQSTTSPKGQVTEVPLSGGALISAMQLPAPEILLRNVTSESTVGIIHTGAETRPFFVFKVASYERTFAGMLAWEVTMARDLAVLYPAKSAGSLAPIATSTPLATSTPIYTEPVRPLATFEDAIVANHDVRVLKDTAGQTLILYGYATKDLLILARDEAAFQGLVSRLSAGK